MDNLGYALDNFNAVGKWREQDDGKSLDVRGKFSSGVQVIGVRELQDFLTQNKMKAINRCITQKLLVYGLGRGLTFKDRPVVDDIIKVGKEGKMNLADLVFEVIKSKPFHFSQ